MSHSRANACAPHCHLFFGADVGHYFAEDSTLGNGLDFNSGQSLDVMDNGVVKDRKCFDYMHLLIC